jgi:hypothetical protein
MSKRTKGPTIVASYRHRPEPRPAEEPDTQAGDYFVFARDAGRVWYLSGPYVNDHAAAIADVEAVRAMAEKSDPFSAFYAFGTCRFPPNSGRIGSIQKAGLTVEKNSEN